MVTSVTVQSDISKQDCSDALGQLAKRLTTRMVSRGQIPAELRELAECYMRQELLRTIRVCTRRVGINSAVLLRTSGMLKTA